VFRKTRSRLLKQRGDERVLAVRLPKFSGILGIEVQPGKRFGKEIAEKVHAVTGLAGIIHSDENLEEYGISAEEISELRLTLGVNEGDAFVLVKAPRETGERALEIVVERARQSLRGVPNETRRALENGNSEFLRELHGGARLYPDTDTPPIRLNPELIDSVARKLPEYPWNIKDKLVKEYGISEEFAEKLILEGKVFLFREIVDEYRVDPVFVASVLLQTLKALEREGVKVEEVTEEELKEVFRQLSENRIAKEAIEPLIAKLAEKRISVEEALKELGISPLSERELEELVGSIVSENIDIVKERGERAFSPLMGMIMKQVRGRIDGSKVAEVLKRKIREGAGG